MHRRPNKGNPKIRESRQTNARHDNLRQHQGGPSSTCCAASPKARRSSPTSSAGRVWDDDHIRSLLASLSLAYPVGTVMVLETGGEEVRFKPRPVQGVYTNGTKPDRLILDGQQRLTSLYLATFYGKPVDAQHARKKLIKRWYYIKMEAALKPDGDRDKAIVSCRRTVWYATSAVMCSRITPPASSSTSMAYFPSNISSTPATGERASRRTGIGIAGRADFLALQGRGHQAF